MQQAKPNSTETIYRNIFWIGGSSKSGKSSIAKYLGDKYKVPTLSTDDYLVRANANKQSDFERQQQASNFIKKFDFESFYNKGIDHCLAILHKSNEKTWSDIKKDLPHLSKTHKVLIIEGTVAFPENLAGISIVRNFVSIATGKELQQKIFFKEMMQPYSGEPTMEAQFFRNYENPLKSVNTRIECHNRISEKIKHQSKRHKTLLVENLTKKDLIKNQTAIEQMFIEFLKANTFPITI